MRAARWEQRESLFFLLSKGADANALDHESKNALHYLFDDPKKTPNIEFYQWLVKNGADVNHPNADGKTPSQLLNQSIAKKFLIQKTDAPLIAD
jgi:ankyrin repeat protein